VSREIDSTALLLANRMLGVAGPGSAATELEDGILNQVLDVAPIVRRSRTLGGSGGWYYALMENVHLAANAQSSTLDLYAAVGPINGYENPLPDRFDCWLMQASCRRIAGAGDLTDGVFSLNPAESQQGCGVDQAGAAFAGSSNMALAVFDGIFTGGIAINTLTNEANYKIGIRVPRGASIIWGTTAGAAATFRGELAIGVFPVTTGQDLLAT